MQFEDKETNKTHITEFIVYLVLGIIATLLCIFMFMPTKLIVKPTLPKNTLDGITVTNIDRVSGTTTFTNKAGDVIKYTYCTDAPVIKSGWYTIKVNNVKHTMSNKDSQIIQRLAYNKCPLPIDCLKSDADILPGTNAKITKSFTDYLLQNNIHNNIVFRGYSPATKQLTYSISNDEPKMITLTLGDVGFYKTAEVDDDDLYCQNNTKKLISTLIVTVIIFGSIFIWLRLTSLIDYIKVKQSQTNLSTANVSTKCIKNQVHTILESHKDKNSINEHITPDHKPSSTICSPGAKKKRHRK